MIDRPDPANIVSRRLFTGVIAALAVAASAYLTQTQDPAHAVPISVLPDLDSPAETAPSAPVPTARATKAAAAPGAGRVFERSIAGIDATPPTF